MFAVDSLTVDRANLHRVWKSILVVIAAAVAAACVARPVVLIGIAPLLLLLLIGRQFYRGRDRYIPNLYARDTAVYDDDYRGFIGRTIADLRRCKIPGHPLLWEASHLSLIHI